MGVSVTDHRRWSAEQQRACTILVAVVFQTNMVSILGSPIKSNRGKRTENHQSVSVGHYFSCGRQSVWSSSCEFSDNFTHLHLPLTMVMICMLFLLWLFRFQTSRILFINFWNLYQLYIAIRFDYLSYSCYIFDSYSCALFSIYGFNNGFIKVTFVAKFNIHQSLCLVFLARKVEGGIVPQ